MIFSAANVILEKITLPKLSLPAECPSVPDSRYAARLSALRTRMAEKELDFVVIYGDREHYSNFKYFVGFEPRFEEGLLVIPREGKAHLWLGNECFPMHPWARLEAEAHLYPAFSLPNQPMEGHIPPGQLYTDSGIRAGARVGVIGWKLFRPEHGADYASMLELSDYLTRPLKELAGQVVNAAGLLIDPDGGLRTINDADEIALLEYGACWAGECVRSVLERMEEGQTEQEAASLMAARGIQYTCHPLVRAGVNSRRGLISPTCTPIHNGDPICISTGLEGGLTCRGGYYADGAGALPEDQRGYVEQLAAPYFAVVASWYSSLRIGVTGGEMYDLVNRVFPQKTYGWGLNPGHLTAYEEWLSALNYPGSPIPYRSGMVVQMDIIPGLAPYSAPNAEDGIAIADEALRAELAEKHPAVYERMQARRRVMETVIGIPLAPELLPMSNMCGIYAPFMKEPSLIFKIKA